MKAKNDLPALADKLLLRNDSVYYMAGNFAIYSLENWVIY